MSRQNKIYLFLLFASIVLVVLNELQKPKPINWFESYVAQHKIPYGTYVLYNELSDLFPKSEIKKVQTPPYLFLKDSTKTGAYILIDKGFNISKVELNRFLKFVARGNQVLMVTHGINIDTLNLETKLLRSTALDEFPFFTLANRVFRNKEYRFDRAFDNFVFKKVDTLATTVLGKTGFVNQDGERVANGVNFISYKYGKGQFLFSTYPEAFINYTLLKSPNQEYAASVLSYLKNPKTIYWDAYYKSGKSQIASPLYYVLSQKSLKYAYYILLLGALVFVLFGGKRVQRIIPIIKPLQNQTLAFTRTIAGMYYKKEAHKTMATHKIRYILTLIRQKYQLNTDIYKKDFTQQLALKVGKRLEETEKIVNYIKYIETQDKVTKEELVTLNAYLNSLIKTSKYGR
ncbi:MAG: DUF4350 domain-containing protein [Flavobacteriaceae bacterium]